MIIIVEPFGCEGCDGSDSNELNNKIYVLLLDVEENKSQYIIDKDYFMIDNHYYMFYKLYINSCHNNYLGYIKLLHRMCCNKVGFYNGIIGYYYNGILIAIRKNNIELLKLCIKLGNLHISRYNEMLCYAAQLGKLDCFIYIYKLGSSLNLRIDYSTLYYHASFSNELNNIKQILKVKN